MCSGYAELIGSERGSFMGADGLNERAQVR